MWSEFPNARRLRRAECSGGIGEVRVNEGATVNGSTLDREGGVICCEHGSRSVTRMNHDGSIETLADRFEGKKFNSPNDVVVKSDGSIWFTDPAYGIESDYEGFEGGGEVGGQHVYRIDGGTGAITRVTDDFTCPNGVAFSLDETKLYIADSGATRYPGAPKHIRVFDVTEDNRLRGGGVFAECENGVFDGFRFDNKGRIWTSAADGVHCYEADGTLIGKIFVPEIVSNLCFGGPKRNRLFLTATSSVYSVLLATSGPRI